MNPRFPICRGFCEHGRNRRLVAVISAFSLAKCVKLYRRPCNMHTYVDFAVFLWTVIYKPMINVLIICFSVALGKKKTAFVYSFCLPVVGRRWI